MSSTECNHLKSAVGFLLPKDLNQLLSHLKCDVCYAENTNLWLCLYSDCYMMGCDAVSVDHSSQHYERFTDHCIQLNVRDKRLWCYQCNKEVKVASDSDNNWPRFDQKLGCVLKPTENGIVRGPPEGIVGLVNLGNTCYMNAALQCLSNTPALSEFFLTCSSLIKKHGGNLAQAYQHLIFDIWSDSSNRKKFIAPYSILCAMRQVNSMFKGFQQHDAQEFLRCFLDKLHDELMEPVPDQKSFIDQANKQTNESGDEDGDEEYYETADSGVSERSSLGEIEPDICSFSKGDVGAIVHKQNGKMPSTLYRRSTKKSRSRPVPPTYRSIVSDVFNGKLMSSVQCLSCDSVSKRLEVFQDLALPIPSSETLNSSFHLSPDSSPELVRSSWFSWIWSWIEGWFYGYSVSLNDCLSIFFSADELKGDNMYSCEKCKKLRNGLKYSRITVLPEMLCIYLKRFRHEFAFSSKICHKVTFPLCHLDMTPWIHEDYATRETTYDLVGVVCHRGSSGGGHYTSFNLNPLDLEWYEFDDEVVRRVEQASVVASEAYVLFYRRNNDSMQPIRNELQRLLDHSRLKPGLIKFWISKQWFNKFENFAEPGPVDNSDFLCVHGGVQPSKTEIVFDLCTSVSQEIWDFIVRRFGMSHFGELSHPCTRLYDCSICRSKMEADMTRKKFELERFKQLHAAFLKNEFCQDSNQLIYCLSTVWFKKWEDFVFNRTNEDPPDEIDNCMIVCSSNEVEALSPLTRLKSSADYIQISSEIWHFFVSIYGGGPVVTLPAKGVGITGNGASEDSCLAIEAINNLKRVSTENVCTP